MSTKKSKKQDETKTDYLLMNGIIGFFVVMIDDISGTPYSGKIIAKERNYYIIEFFKPFIKEFELSGIIILKDIKELLDNRKVKLFNNIDTFIDYCKTHIVTYN